ncbi:hypothetical protein SCP_0305810 [Sparassis crispa]|uniref:Kynurenine formamidase n=1 Tax=Sparassis crispa TaxID=139825 RepID=A0A401GFF9_9APHY|nr:hypothetical protein SCP_0305810 [Sparassis crispa]GBE80861.1 hypothetical protein SCP_0305810 [Sparassis crispa]
MSSPKRAIIDLTHPLVPAGVPACPGHPIYNAELISSLSAGAFANVHALSLGSHTGTHLDAPYHFFMDGAPIHALDLELLAAAPALVVDLRAKPAHAPITWADLTPHAHAMRSGVALLLCTGWSRFYGQENYSDHPWLEPDAARRVLEMGVRVIGMDALSPDEWAAGVDTGMVHRIVLGSGGVIVENLCGLGRLVESGWERPLVSLLPLNLQGCDGSPIRAVAWEGKEESGSSV